MPYLLTYTYRAKSLIKAKTKMKFQSIKGAEDHLLEFIMSKLSGHLGKTIEKVAMLDRSVRSIGIQTKGRLDIDVRKQVKKLGRKDMVILLKGLFSVHGPNYDTYFSIEQIDELGMTVTNGYSVEVSNAVYTKGQTL